MRLIFLTGLLCLSQLVFAARPLSPSAQISVLTCSDGQELYSTFGHNALRIVDTDQTLDVVYNYGTFQFGDSEVGFAYKFARGKLEYILAKESFAGFNLTYIRENRGIVEQTLDLTLVQKQALFDALEENAKEENRAYRYDFLFDNCATRIRDILKKVLGEGLEYPFTQDPEITFREMLQPHLEQMPWADYGIDIALGMPCDAKVGVDENMFLPANMMQEFAVATLNGKPLVSKTEEILPEQLEEVPETFWTPTVVNWLVLGILALIYLVLRIKDIQALALDRLILFVLGLGGLLVFFLWFLTDHTATINNFNIIWAFPLVFFMAFIIRKNSAWWVKRFFKLFAFAQVTLLVFWIAVPQDLHEALIPLVILLAIVSFRVAWPFLAKNQQWHVENPQD